MAIAFSTPTITNYLLHHHHVTFTIVTSVASFITATAMEKEERENVANKEEETKMWNKKFFICLAKLFSKHISCRSVSKTHSRKFVLKSYSEKYFSKYISYILKKLFPKLRSKNPVLEITIQKSCSEIFFLKSFMNI